MLVREGCKASKARILRSMTRPDQNLKIIKKGDSVLIERGLPHQLIALTDNSTIVEVSTQHFDEDSYRIYRDTPQDLLK